MEFEVARACLQEHNKDVRDYALRRLNDRVLEDVDFLQAPGGAQHHHNYRHGLVIHVAEVMLNVWYMTKFTTSDELVTAVIWHDYMKIKDYKLSGEDILEEPYRKLISHVAGSAMEFHRLAYGKVSTTTLECIEHLLLSHHGRKEWGSPVEPATAEAFILHAADMMSAKGVNL
jgi:3'-5' exoribonuclease